MTDVTTVVETAGVVAEKAAPAMATGTLDYKKVALVAGGVILVGVGAYICKKQIDKRREAKTIVIEAKAGEETSEPKEEVVEEPKAPAEEKKKK